MATMTVLPSVRYPKEHDRWRSSSSTSKLFLPDCSSDLRRYCRSLGPDAQDQRALISSLSNQALRRGFQEHEHLGIGSSSVDAYRRGGNATPQPAFPDASAKGTESETTIYQPTPVPPPAQQILQHHAPTPPLLTGYGFSRPVPTTVGYEDPHPQDPSTWPPTLVDTLKRSQLQNARSQGRDQDEEDQSIIFHVISETHSHYEDEQTDMIGTYRDLVTANEKAAAHFIEEYGGVLALADEPARYELRSDGCVELSVDTNDSDVGSINVFVKRAKIKV